MDGRLDYPEVPELTAHAARLFAVRIDRVFEQSGVFGSTGLGLRLNVRRSLGDSGLRLTSHGFRELWNLGIDLDPDTHRRHQSTSTTNTRRDNSQGTRVATCFTSYVTES